MFDSDDGLDVEKEDQSQGIVMEDAMRSLDSLLKEARRKSSGQHEQEGPDDDDEEEVIDSSEEEGSDYEDEKVCKEMTVDVSDDEMKDTEATHVTREQQEESEQNNKSPADDITAIIKRSPTKASPQKSPASSMDVPQLSASPKQTTAKTPTSVRRSSRSRRSMMDLENIDESTVSDSDDSVVVVTRYPDIDTLSKDYSVFLNPNVSKRGSATKFIGQRSTTRAMSQQFEFESEPDFSPVKKNVKPSQFLTIQSKRVAELREGEEGVKPKKRRASLTPELSTKTTTASVSTELTNKSSRRRSMPVSLAENVGSKKSTETPTSKASADQGSTKSPVTKSTIRKSYVIPCQSCNPDDSPVRRMTSIKEKERSMPASTANTTASIKIDRELLTGIQAGMLATRRSRRLSEMSTVSVESEEGHGPGKAMRRRSVNPVNSSSMLPEEPIVKISHAKVTAAQLGEKQIHTTRHFIFINVCFHV